jgi:hypothetical protein
MASARRQTNKAFGDTIKYHLEPGEAVQILTDWTLLMDERLDEMLALLKEHSNQLRGMNDRLDRLESDSQRLVRLERAAEEWEQTHSLMYYIRHRPLAAFIVSLGWFIIMLAITIPIWMAEVRMGIVGRLGDDYANDVAYLSVLFLLVVLAAIAWMARDIKNGD